MEESPEVTKLKKITETDIREKALNILPERQVRKAVEIRDGLNELVGILHNIQVPTYINEFITGYVKRFLSLYDSIRPGNTPDFDPLYKAFYYGSSNGEYTIPFLLLWAKQAHKEMQSADDFEKPVNALIDKRIKLVKIEYQKKSNDLAQSIEKSEAIIELLNKASGKVAVERYAEIFQDQSTMHSRLKLPDGWNKTTELKMGAAEQWLTAGVVSSLILLSLFIFIDKFISIEGNTWTPNNVTHIIGRFVIVSLLIFIISFCFKQFRINKHLHVLNTHRANTLKSFEYLTKAPDQLDPASYNAILMKVAESIYESGHTGYINSTDGHAEMPSIIDMTRILNVANPKT